MSENQEQYYKVLYLGDNARAHLNGDVKLHKYIGWERSLYGLAGRLNEKVDLQEMDLIIIDFLGSVSSAFKDEILPNYNFQGRVHVLERHGSLEKAIEEIRQKS